MADLELFYWLRPEDGYEWKAGKAMPAQRLDEADRQETRFLVARPSERHLRYKPLLMYPTLHHDFAALEPTESGFLKFANEYGDLGVGVFLEDSFPMVTAEPFRWWALAHAEMKHVVEVLTALQTDDAGTLRQWFTLTPGGARYERHWPSGAGEMGWVTVAGELRDHVWKWASAARSDNEAIFRVARGWAQDKINEALSGSGNRSTLTSARVIFDQDREKMTLRLTPGNLLGALWLQCARELTVRPKFRMCENCGKWFELSPETRRRQSKYCSDRCKVAAYRKRKAGASLDESGGA